MTKRAVIPNLCFIKRHQGSSTFVEKYTQYIIIRELFQEGMNMVGNNLKVGVRMAILLVTVLLLLVAVGYTGYRGVTSVRKANMELLDKDVQLFAAFSEIR